MYLVLTDDVLVMTMLIKPQSNLAKALDIVLDAEGVLGSKRMKRFSMLLRVRSELLNVERRHWPRVLAGCRRSPKTSSPSTGFLYHVSFL
jgi:hypothetical protein